MPFWFLLIWYRSAAVTLLCWLSLFSRTSLYPLRIILFICWLFWQLLRQVLKQFINSDILFCTNFVILQSKSPCIIVCFVFGNLMLIQIDLITYNNDPDIGSCLLIKFLDPLLTLLKWFPAGHVEYYACTYGILIIHLCEWTVSLLSSCVPHFVLHNVITEIFILCKEATSNGSLMRWWELSICVSIRK